MEHRQATAVSLIRAGGEANEAKTHRVASNQRALDLLQRFFPCLQMLSKWTDRRGASFGQRISFSWTYRHFQLSFLGDLCQRCPDKSLIYLVSVTVSQHAATRGGGRSSPVLFLPHVGGENASCQTELFHRRLLRSFNRSVFVSELPGS